MSLTSRTCTPEGTAVTPYIVRPSGEKETPCELGPTVATMITRGRDGVLTSIAVTCPVAVIA